MSKVKKIITIIVFVVCIFATLCVPVSAVVSNGAIITGLSSSYIRMNSTTDYYSATVTQSNYSITNSYQISGPVTNLIDTYNRLEFKSSNSYGLLKICAYSVGGSAYHSEASIINWNGLYNTETGVKLASASLDHDSFLVTYEGYIPTYIEFRGYFTINSPNDVLQSVVICDIEFFPLTDPNKADNDDIIVNQDKNADKITQNNDKNTDKIIDNQNQLQENEKNEAESSGQGSVDDISGAIEDKSAGFISSITSLVSSMSYEGTACAWSFPALKLPAIEGVMPEYQLTEEKPIDFEFWVNKIPADILLLVRSLLTIALIGYCFKELYSTISYVLTLKGGGNNE